MPTNEEVKKARLDLKETQAAFASRFGVDQATVHRWETNGLPQHGAARRAVEKFLEDIGNSREAAE